MSTPSIAWGKSRVSGLDDQSIIRWKDIAAGLLVREAGALVIERPMAPILNQGETGTFHFI